MANGLNENSVSAWFRATLAVVNISSVLASVGIAFIFSGASARFLAFIFGASSLFVLQTLAADGTWVRRYIDHSSWFRSSWREWRSRDENPSSFWFHVFGGHLVPIFLLFISGRNSHASTLYSGLAAGTLQIYFLTSFLMSVLVAAIWYLLPMNWAVRFPSFAFIVHRDFFLYGFFALSVRVAKADGHISAQEITQLQNFMDDTLELSTRERNFARNVFAYTKSSSQSTYDIAKLCRRRYRSNPEVLATMIDLLLWLALAQNKKYSAELEAVQHISDIFGISESRFKKLRSDNLRQAGLESDEATQNDGSSKNQGKPKQEQTHIPHPYRVLESKPEDSWEAIKANYYRLLKQNHPDRLASRGVPKAALERAKRRTQEIVQAYNELKQLRGKK